MQRDTTIRVTKEHDHMDLNIVIDIGTKESGSGFRGQEESAAHEELDIILEELSTSKQEDRKDGQEKEPATVDFCSSSAYFGGGTWWLDRTNKQTGVSLLYTLYGQCC